jgi:hypothetical protein
MRPFSTAAFLCLFACSPAKNVSELSRLDNNLVMPTEAGPSEDYDRYYAKTTEGWVGVLRSTEKGSGKAQMTTEDKLPYISDGGCDQVNVRFDANMKIISAFCNGDA